MLLIKRLFYCAVFAVNANPVEDTKVVPPPVIGTPVSTSPRFNRDDIFYPIETLIEYADAGMDVSDFKVANTMEGSNTPFGMPVRGIQVSTDWDVETSDGLIGMEYSMVYYLFYEKVIFLILVSHLFRHLRSN